jgi:hypothetical protein
MPRVADLIECVYQSVLSVRLECNAQVDDRIVGGMTVILPLVRNGAPRMLHLHVVPSWCNGVGEAYRHSAEDGQQEEPMHGYCGRIRRTGGETENNGLATAREEQTAKSRAFTIAVISTFCVSRGDKEHHGEAGWLLPFIVYHA